MLIPAPGVVSAYASDIREGGYLYAVSPFRGALDDKPVSDINTDVPREPNELSRYDL